MASTAIQNLQAALKASVDAQAPFALDAAYLTAGMASPDVTLPAAYDANLAKAFQVAAAADFKVSAKAGSVGPVADDRFSVKDVSLPFIGVALDGSGTLTFALSTDGATLVVTIDSKPAKWSWTTSFPTMTDWQFKVLPVSSATFTFTSTAGPRQAAVIACGVPASAIPLFTLFDPVITPPTLVTLRGDLDLSTYDGKKVLFPSGTLRGAISDGSFSLIYLKVSKPAIALTLPPPANAQGKTIADTQQTAQLSISTELAVDGAASAFLIEVALPQQAEGRTPFFMSMRAIAGGPQLTPSTVLALAGGAQSGGRSYLSSVPPVLQEFMTSVSLRGLSLAGIVGAPPTLSRIGLDIGSVPGMKWTPLPDAPTGLDFTFTAFSLSWLLIDPFSAASRQQTFQFSTQFTLAPAIFKGKTPGSDGVFTVSFGSDMQFEASFAGTASLRDFVDVLSGGSITLPDGVNASVSDISTTVDYTERSFAFGSGFEVEVSFLEVGGKPILAISNGHVALEAMTPTQQGGDNKTQWKAAIAGTLAVGPIGANVLVAYDGFQDPARWLLKAQLAEPIDIGSVIQQFFDPYGSYDFPDFLPGTLLLKTFDITAQLASKGGKPPTTYAIDTTFSWLFDLGDQKVGIDPAHLMVAYDGAKPASQQFSGLVEGTWVYTAINLELKMGYQFQPTAEGPNDTLYVEWEGFRATYETGKEQLTFSLKGWTVGTLIQSLVRTLGDPYFTLGSPWDLLNQISLDGLSLIVSLKSGVKNRLSASYTLSSPINLGFIVIKGLIFRRDTEGKVTLAIDGTVPSPLQGSMGDLLNPEKGQDVQNMPSVPGAGEEYFKVYLLALGQRIGITGYESFATTQEAILALEGVPNTVGKQNPVNPTANIGSIQKGIPYYEPANHWLIAGHLGVLKIAGVWTVDVKLVFNDPNLYGLRLALAGPRAGGLAGLVVDILYKKITDDIGLFQIEFTFPDSIRNLNFGAVSVVLPQIGIQVYTNGDFLIDISFPYNLDFRRSFSISAIVYGVPVLGSGGLYFGKLSSATATQVPRTQLGTFNPVIVFGLGLQLGLGYNFVKGPLQAGFALTVFGIIEGVIAAWHPYSPARSTGSDLALAGQGSLQDEYYFKISGTVGIIGLLYGKVDFAIIQASVNVNITLSLKITYESYRAIPLIATARVDVSLKVKIDLGIFSISISLSFAMTVTASFVIGSDSKAPWDSPALAASHARRRQLLTEGPAAIRARARQLRARPRRLPAHVVAAANKPKLSLITAPQYTVLATEGATDPSTQQGAFVFLLAMDAPTADGAASGQTSFDLLCQAYFPWLVDALGGDPARLSRVELETFVARIADLKDPALSTGDLLGFLADHFTLDISTAQSSDQRTRDAMTAGAMLFPVFDGLSLSVPDPTGGTGSKPVTFETYATATPGYRDQVSSTFNEVAVRIREEAEAPHLFVGDDTPESLASLVFGDTFSIVGRQLLQAALDALDAYVYKLSNTASSPDSIGWIIDWANQRGNELLPDDVALPNQDHALTPATRLTLAGLSTTLQASDTVRSVAARYSDPTSPARWTTPAASLVTGNGDARVLRTGVLLKLTNADHASVDYVTTPGDSFAAIAVALGITLDALSTQATLLDAADLLAPAAALSIPSFAYACASGDTLSGIAATFATTVSALAVTNLQVAGLFALDANGGALSLANLSMLPATDLWSAIQATDQVAMTAGMVSRFLMFGLRLPNSTGLSLSSQFLYPTQQAGYGLYQLTGQQFPVPSALGNGANYTIEIARADASHGVPLDFIWFNNAAGKQAEVELTSAWNLLDIVVTWARTGAFQPAPSFEALPLADTTARTIALGNPALWSTSDRAALGAVTDRGQGSGNPLAQPTWWSLPGGVIAETAARQSALAPLFPDLGELMQRMPRYAPSRVVNSASGADSTLLPLTSFAWGTRVDVQVKRMPAQSVAEVQPQGEGSVPSGPAMAPSLPNVYELVGPTSETGAQLAGMMRAMAALGPSLTSSVSLLYSQATGAAAGSGDAVELVSLGAAEFLSFVTQTNLSTESNPEDTNRTARLDVEAPHGIANAPAELARLLWELSVVRNGGYYLYYRVLDGDAGLPASLFDASGTATLSFVFTLATQGAASIGETPLDFVNGFVTTDDIDRQRDTVELVAQPGGSTSQPLDGQASLVQLAETYGVSVGRLATGNPLAIVTAGSRLGIVGIQRQLGPADVLNPATTLETLAAYYSQGAATPITAADIAMLNPGVAVALGAVFYIPAVEYVVAANARPGQTLDSIARYYALSLDALAVLIAATPRLLVAGTVLNLDTQALEPRTTIGPANVGISLERANLGDPTLPPNPTPGDKETFARASMYSLYNTLSAGFAANAWFTASPLGLPFGPQNDVDASAPAHPLRAAAHRRDRLAAALGNDYRYRQVLGLGAFAKVNPAIEFAFAPAADNPYIGVGTPAQIALQWQDLFGNTTVTPFSAVPAGYTGAINGEAVPIRYRDTLINPSGWPQALLYYTYSGDATGAMLDIELQLSTQNYAGQQGQASRDLALYQTVYYQLHQDYTGQNVPNVTGNAVGMQLTNSLLSQPLRALSDTEASIIRTFVAGCVAYLAAVAGDTTLPPVPKATLSVPVDPTALAAVDLIELDLTLSLARQPLLVDPDIAALPGGISVDCPVLPKPDGGESIAYTDFARRFETVFQTKAWQLRIGEGLRAQTDTGGGSRQLWAVRFGTDGIAFDIGDAASYYAAKPISRALVNRSATITPYPGKDSVTSSFTGVDQNLWFQAVLDAVDTFLSGPTSTSVYVLDELLGANDPLIDGYLGKVLAAKQSLADSISTSVAPILSTSADDSSSLWAAQTTLRQQLLNQLGPAYAAGATLVFGLDDVTGGSGDLPPRLYGQPRATIAAESANENYSLSPARLPLGPTTVDKTAYAPRLAFALTTKNVTSTKSVAAQAYIPLDLHYQISHMEFGRSAVPGIDGYLQSQWLAFVSGPIDVALGTGTSNVPVINRALPVPPTMTLQTGEKLHLQPGSADQLPLWTYRFTYSGDQAAQDLVHITIELNAPIESLATPGPNALDLFSALAQFVSSYPAVSTDLSLSLPAIGAGSADESIVQMAQGAVAAFQEMVGAVAAALAADAPKAEALALGDAPARIEITMDTRLDRTDGGEAISEILDLQIDGLAATWDVAAGTISNGPITLPAPWIEIASDTYQAEPVSPPPTNVGIAYRYRDAEGNYLLFDAARAIASRSISMQGLNVLTHQHAWSSLQVMRNRILTPIADAATIKTREDFIFQTPTVRFASPLVPRLEYATFSLDGVAPAGAGVADVLTAFYAALFTGGNGKVESSVTMTSAYSYQLIPGVPRTVLPIAMLPPADVPVVATPAPAFVQPLAGVIDDWIATQDPTRTGEPQLNFTLTAFATTGGRQPLLVVNDLARKIPS